MNESISKIIEEHAAKLSIREHTKLLEKLTLQLKEKSIKTDQSLDWNKLYGLGKGIWNDMDAQDHVDRLREDRI